MLSFRKWPSTDTESIILTRRGTLLEVHYVSWLIGSKLGLEEVTDVESNQRELKP